MDYTTRIANTTFDHLFINAAGVYCQTAEQLDQIQEAEAVAAVMTKSATAELRLGNQEPRYAAFPDQHNTINSMGLPNLGLDYYLNYVLKSHLKRPTIFSVVGLSQTEIVANLKKLQVSNYTGLAELNLSCPNVPGEPQIAYDFQTTDEILKQVFAFYGKPLGIKLPPYFDLAHFDQIAKILNRYPLAYVNSINSVGNGLVIDPKTDKVVIRPKDGFGGLGGAQIKATALANVRALRLRLRPEIKMIGTGGVTCGRDVFDHLLCGADLVSVGSQLAIEGPTVFARLEKELEAIFTEKQITSLDQVRGRLKIF
ncbi:dihydroorotate dehydrogenase [Oenococcus sicerae]|uniref:dihydroorotate oxidase n=1 Tax=Oenococcus sicerae TaxID=2203724 RepID=UPI0010AF974C|nr:Dihydroorotate dehydrogenase A (fumarate) [Oenococcus sicerae]